MNELLPRIENWFEFLGVHKELLQDEIRVEAYNKVIKHVVRKGSVVVDLGTGTGLLAFLAVRAGASKVYAIESMNIIRLAEEIAWANSMADRITFIKGDSRDVTLPERVDILLSEVIGHCVIDENMLDSVIDARCRFLKKGGQMVPQVIEMLFAPVFDEEVYERLMFWKDQICNIDYAPTWKKAVNTVYVGSWNNQAFLSSPQVLASIDLTSVSKVDLSGKAAYTTKRTGTLHGFAGWFKATLNNKPQIEINTGPDKPNTHWGYAFFPIEEPVLVKKNQTILFELNCYSNSGSTTLEWIVNVLSKNNSLISQAQHSTALY